MRLINQSHFAQLMECVTMILWSWICTTGKCYKKRTFYRNKFCKSISSPETARLLIAGCIWSWTKVWRHSTKSLIKTSYFPVGVLTNQFEFQLFSGLQRCDRRSRTCQRYFQQFRGCPKCDRQSRTCQRYFQGIRSWPVSANTICIK